MLFTLRPFRNLAALLVLLSVGLLQSSLASESYQEWSDGAETHHADSDGDGYTDDEEITEGSDPYDHDSKPLSSFTEMVEVMPGVLPTASQLAGQSVGEFYIGKYEVVWAEWKSVRDWAIANGYSDLDNVGEGSADDHPVRNVSFYDALKWCNALSEKEGLVPVYMAGGDIYKLGQTIPVVNSLANGYRLPTEAEWEWAARGGSLGKHYRFSGSDDSNAAGWNSENAGGAFVDLSAGLGTWGVGLKQPNELGLYDMSGNVSEWCFEENSISANQPSRGGSWNDSAASNELSTRFTVPMENRISQVGFRLVKTDNESSHLEPSYGLHSLDEQDSHEYFKLFTSSYSISHDDSSDSDHSDDHDGSSHHSSSYSTSSTSHSESSHDDHRDDDRSEKKNRSKKYKNDDRRSGGEKSHYEGSDDGHSKKTKKSKRKYQRSGDDKNYSESEGGDDNSKKKNRSKKKSRSKKSNS